MSRERWFCQLCGAMTARQPDASGRSLCQAHSLLAVDAELVEPLESLPSMRERTPQTCQACRGTGREWPDVECDRCNGIGYLPAARELG